MPHALETEIIYGPRPWNHEAAELRGVLVVVVFCYCWFLVFCLLFFVGCFFFFFVLFCFVFVFFFFLGGGGGGEGACVKVVSTNPIRDTLLSGVFRRETVSVSADCPNAVSPSVCVIDGSQVSLRHSVQTFICYAARFDTS